MLTDTILKKYSSTVATIFTGIASAVLFGHTLTMNFLLGISIVFISMHQVIIRNIFVGWQFSIEGKPLYDANASFPLNISSFFHQFQKWKMNSKMDQWN